MARTMTAARVEQPLNCTFRLQWLDEAQPTDEAFGAFCRWYAEQQLRDGLAEANGGQPDLARLQQVVVLTHLARTNATREEAQQELAMLRRRPGGLGAAASELLVIFETLSDVASRIAY